MNLDNTRWLFAINNNVLKVNTEDVTHEESLIRPTSGGNCINWAVGHLLRSRQFLLKVALKDWSIPPEVEKAYERGSSGDDFHLFPQFPELLAMWDETQTLLDEALTALTADQLHQIEPPFGDFSRPDTRERRILFLHFHESYHLGQLGLMRRLLGKEGAIK